MGLLNWLFNRPTGFQAEPDRVYITAPPKWSAFTQFVQQRIDGGERVLIAAYFPATLREAQQRVSDCGLSVQMIDRPVRGVELPAVMPPASTRTVMLAPLPALLADEATEAPQSPASTDRLTIAVPEVHPLRDAERRLLAFAGAIPMQVRVQPFASLDEPLMKVFAGARVQELLRHMGMKEDEPIESLMVSRQIRRAQERLSQRVRSFEPADSAAEWMQRNVTSAD